MRAYGRLLRVPGMAALLASALLTRLPIGINGLAVVLFLRAETGSFSEAGVAAGALALGAGFGAPVGARLVDRFGARVLLALACAHAAMLGAVVALGKLGAPGGAIVPAAFLAGLALPPTSSVLRAQYPHLLGGELVQTAFALDSVVTEVIFIAGPALVALLVATVSAAAALVVSAVAVIVGTVLFLGRLPAGAGQRGADVASPGRLGALRSAGIRTLVLSMLPVGIALGALEVSLPAFADAEGRRDLAGLLIALWSIGSAAGGLAYGARPRRAPLARVHLQIALLLPLTLAPVALASSPATMAALVIPAGVCLAPLIATRNELAGTVAPPGAETEAYTWPLTALVAGVAAGAAIAGVLADGAGWRAAVIVGACSAALGATISLARRGTLAPAVRS